MADCTGAQVVEEQVPSIDGCQILAKLPIFVIEGGGVRYLAHVFRDASGNAYDLSECLDPTSLSESTSDSNSESLAEAANSAIARFQEVLSLGSGCGLYEAPAVVEDYNTGRVQTIVPEAVANRPGVYRVDWAVMNSAGKPIIINESWMLVERSLFLDPTNRAANGPPSMREIRLSLRDSALENAAIMDDVEFPAVEVMQAIYRPVEEWNNSTPQLRPRYTTHNFPYREAWHKAVQGYLLFIAAHWYRRTHLDYSAGGVTINDRAKENPYLVTAKLLLDEWKRFILVKKKELNALACFGSVGSSYGGLRGD